MVIARFVVSGWVGLVSHSKLQLLSQPAFEELLKERGRKERV